MLVTFNQFIVIELGLSIFETRIEPVNDSSLRVQWLRNGTSLANANRIQV